MAPRHARRERPAHRLAGEILGRVDEHDTGAVGEQVVHGRRIGRSTTTGRSRRAFLWYLAYSGKPSITRSHSRGLSSAVAGRARAGNRSAPTCTATSGSATRLRYQSGYLGSPPLDTTTTYSSPSRQ